MSTSKIVSYLFLKQINVVGTFQVPWPWLTETVWVIKQLSNIALVIKLFCRSMIVLDHDETKGKYVIGANSIQSKRMLAMHF